MPTIKKPNQHFDAVLWTGTGSTQSITNAGGFQPDFVWGKRRNGIASNILIDSIVGGNPPERYLSSDTTSATTANADVITALNSNGFTVGASGALNGSTNTYVGWQWKAGGASTVNTSGTISSNVSVNATAGFSVVTYTGAGTAATVGHGLGVAPKIVIVKQRNSTSDWTVYTTAIDGSLDFLYLNLTLAKGDSGLSLPTSTVFSLGTSTDTNGSGSTYVAYCWAEVEGYSKFGSYTGNGSADGPFVYLGFRPSFVIVKQSSAAGRNWIMFDNKRDTKNEVLNSLEPSNSDAEYPNTTGLDFLSNGFKIRSTGPSLNTSTATYIYMAFAESPFKFSNAR